MRQSIERLCIDIEESRNQKEIYQIKAFLFGAELSEDFLRRFDIKLVEKVLQDLASYTDEQFKMQNNFALNNLKSNILGLINTEFYHYTLKEPLKKIFTTLKLNHKYVKSHIILKFILSRIEYLIYIRGVDKLKDELLESLKNAMESNYDRNQEDVGILIQYFSDANDQDICNLLEGQILTTKNEIDIEIKTIASNISRIMFYYKNEQFRSFIKSEFEKMDKSYKSYGDAASTKTSRFYASLRVLNGLFSSKEVLSMNVNAHSIIYHMNIIFTTESINDQHKAPGYSYNRIDGGFLGKDSELETKLVTSMNKTYLILTQNEVGSISEKYRFLQDLLLLKFNEAEYLALCIRRKSIN